MIYLNNAATSFPKPDAVAEAMAACVRSLPLDPRRGGSRDTPNALDALRRKVAELIGASDATRIAFSSGSTESLNTAIRGLPLAGTHVVTTATEHNSVLRPLHTLERDAGVNLTVVPCDADGFVCPEALTSALTDETRLLAVNHASNVTGTVQDIAATCALAHDQGVPVLVDASQSLGFVPIDVEKMGTDMLAFTGHKSLYGPEGTGGLYVREGIDLAPLKSGGTGTRGRLKYQPPEMPKRLEAGTPNLPGLAGLSAALDCMDAIGRASVRSRLTVLMQRLLDGLRRIEKVRVIGHGAGCDHVPVAALSIAGLSPRDVAYMLEHSFGIIVRAGLHCAPLIHTHLGTADEGSVRVSPSWFTKEMEIDAFLEAIDEIAKAS